MTDSGYYIWGERRRNRSFDYKIKSINTRGKFDGFKDNRNKEKCKAEHGEKAAAYEEDKCKNDFAFYKKPEEETTDNTQ